MPKTLKMPSQAELPDGPWRDFVEALFHYYREANRPDLRAIAEAVNRLSDNHRPGTASRETIRQMLRGRTVPRQWFTAETAFRALCELADIRPDDYPDGLDGLGSDDTHLGAFRKLWDAAADVPHPLSEAAAPPVEGRAKQTLAGKTPDHIVSTPHIILPGRDGIDSGETAPKTNQSAQIGGPWSTRILDDALRVSWSIPDERWKASALAHIAKAVAAVDLDRAARLAADAERVARSISRAYDQAHALADVVRAVAVVDPDRAVRLAADAESVTWSISKDNDDRSWAMVDLGLALAVVAPSIAERLVRSDGRDHCLISLVVAMAVADPDRAERIAQSVTQDRKESALAGLAEALAAVYPDRAERIAESITGDKKAVTLACIAEAVAVADRDRAVRLAADAERIAQSVAGGDTAVTLARIGKAVAVADPSRAARLAADAERIAQLKTYQDQLKTYQDGKAYDLVRVAEAVMTVDRGRAVRLIDDAERIAWSLISEHWKEMVITRCAVAVSATDPLRAERTVQLIPLPVSFTWGETESRGRIARAVAVADLETAERIAQSIINPFDKAITLACIAVAPGATEPGSA